MQKFPLTELALLCSFFLTQMTITTYAAELESKKVQEPQIADNNQKEKQLEVISIFGQRNQLATATGSAFVLGEETLDQFEFDDIHRVLQSVSGVYIREEDGYGLRPNIGLRGATTERSSKVAIMEDGILIAPAPYAAPAAYYFPLMSRMTQVEIFKGPSAIKYGPNTVGGAINMLSRPISSAKKPQAQIDLALGQDNYQKAHGYLSQTKTLAGYGDIGFLIEGLTINSDGFKALDGGGDTGFKKNEIIFKLNFVPSNAQYYQIWQFKGGYSDEVSNETYLGLTDTDFIENAERRYIASKNDKMDWEHYQFQLSHYIELNDQTSFYTQAYHREFDRDWDRLDSFNSSRSMQTILTSPETGINALFMEVLKGKRDSATSEENLLFTLNDRRYYSQGLETKLLWDSELMGADLALDAGLRFHRDEVERNHRSNQYFMQGGELVFADEQQQTTTQNKDSATALASYVNANVDFGQFNITTGVRVEYIKGESYDYLTGEKLTSSDTVVMPGLGIFYKIDESLGLLLGVNKGYVPNSPGQGDSVDPEESWNYEFGLRYSQQDFRAEVIGFYNNYSNLKGTCTFSSGCDQTLDEEFNAGEVNVYGLEASFTAEFELTKGLTLPINVAFTHTMSEFQNSFKSSFSQWGRVESGDALPYLPQNQISIEMALQHENWRAALLLKHVEAMQEATGDNTELSRLWTDELLQLDLSSWYLLSNHVKAYLKIDNLTDETAVVSRRPFGARPGKPRQVTIGMKFTF
ncbi:TonB-dependent receptor family protein [Colwellia hornerae]|uniref:TonB-dependent receptor n=1 Tax=Colwellia hornerae TaxID=89402 RepID=A0A5C6Q2M7_9GAMM|nr:TonB-dependent receptor [Colwellia hornerae]TWX46379.1 TonB-dependent receptor [Colwellia hornerae]TWX54188.1 TonB-dependent receptor [Colwellia hornerae]TWX63094.1 TonB-dependent receptor [Colwellia hornerae]